MFIGVNKHFFSGEYIPRFYSGLMIEFYAHAAMKNRVHVGFAVTGLNTDEISLFEASGKTMRHIKIPTLEDIDEEKLVELIEMVNKKAICK